MSLCCRHLSSLRFGKNDDTLSLDYIYTYSNIFTFVVNISSIWTTFKGTTAEPHRPVHFFGAECDSASRWEHRLRDAERFRSVPFVVPYAEAFTPGMTLAERIGLRFHAMRLAAFYQEHGCTVVPVLPITDAASLDLLLEGLPENSTFAVDLKGPPDIWKPAIQRAIDCLHPAMLLATSPRLLPSVPWDTPTYGGLRRRFVRLPFSQHPGDDRRTRFLLENPQVMAPVIRRYGLSAVEADLKQEILLRSLQAPCLFDPSKGDLATYAMNLAESFCRTLAPVEHSQPRTGLQDVATDGSCIRLSEIVLNAVHFPAVQSRLNSAAAEARSPDSFLILRIFVRVEDPFLNYAQQNQRNHTNEQMRLDVFRRANVNRADRQGPFISRNGSSICVRPWYLSVHPTSAYLLR